MGILDFLGEKTTTQSSSTFDKTTEGAQTDLSPELLAALSSLFGNTLGSGSFDASRLAMTDRLSEVGGFNTQAHADAITEKAKAFAELDLESGINQISSRAGGSASSNSMVALLANKLRNQTAANIGGINSAAKLDAEKFKTEGVNALGQGLSKQVLDLISVARGAQTQGSLKEHGTESGRSKTKKPFSFGDIFTNVLTSMLTGGGGG